MIEIEYLLDLLNKIEEQIKESKKTTKERLKLEAEKMYTFYALKICLDKLTNTDTVENKEGIKRTKIYLEKIEKLDLQ